MIREIVSGDIDECVRAYMEAFNCEPWNNQWTEELAKRYLGEYMSNQRFVGFGFWVDSHLCGAIFARLYTWWYDQEMYIDEFFVQGSRANQGIGTQLIDYAKEYCKSNGVECITLLTNKNYRAKDFYEKNGLKVVEDYILMDIDIK